MFIIIAKIFAIIGFLLITWGIFAKNEVKQDWIFILGSLGLLIYSISIRDPIFIPLQIIFISASLYEIYKIKKKK